MSVLSADRMGAISGASELHALSKWIRYNRADTKQITDSKVMESAMRFFSSAPIEFNMRAPTHDLLRCFNDLCTVQTYCAREDVQLPDKEALAEKVLKTKAELTAAWIHNYLSPNYFHSYLVPAYQTLSEREGEALFDRGLQSFDDDQIRQLDDAQLWQLHEDMGGLYFRGAPESKAAQERINKAAALRLQAPTREEALEHIQRLVDSKDRVKENVRYDSTLGKRVVEMTVRVHADGGILERIKAGLAKFFGRVGTSPPSRRTAEVLLLDLGKLDRSRDDVAGLARRLSENEWFKETLKHNPDLRRRFEELERGLTEQKT